MGPTITRSDTKSGESQGRRHICRLPSGERFGGECWVGEG